MTPTRTRRDRVVHAGGASLLAACALVVAVPASAGAELAFFANGRSMSVSGHRVEGEQLVFELRGGGEMTVDRSVVQAILPDEVPYPVATPAAGAEGAPADEDAAAGNVRATAPAYVERLIERVAGEHGVDAALVRAVVAVESQFQPRARSRKGAIGLMQVLPSTARQYGIANLYDPGSNLQAGVRHLKGLLDRLPLALALAAYNAGEGAVQQFRGIPPYPETRAYVARVRSLLGR
jgi:soluble lytic murein transglycosylase-like protein